MNVTVIAGSHRPQSQSTRISHIIKKHLDPKAESIEILDLGGNPLPLWDEGVWEKSEKWKEIWHPWSTRLEKSDALVVVCPEWGGMVPPGLKNFFLLATQGQIAHKPALIVTVSSGVSGSYPVSELRMSAYKNNKICFIPDQVIIRQVESVLIQEDSPSESDLRIMARLSWSLKVLLAYAGAFRQLRADLREIGNQFPYGM